MTFFKLLVTNQFKRVLYGAFQLDQTYSDAAVYMISGIQLVQSASQVTKKKNSVKIFWDVKKYLPW